MHFWCLCIFQASVKTSHMADSLIPEYLNMHDLTVIWLSTLKSFYLRAWCKNSLSLYISNWQTVWEIIHSLFEGKMQPCCSFKFKLYDFFVKSQGSYTFLQLNSDYNVLFYRLQHFHFISFWLPKGKNKTPKWCLDLQCSGNVFFTSSLRSIHNRGRRGHPVCEVFFQSHFKYITLSDIGSVAAHLTLLSMVRNVFMHGLSVKFCIIWHRR